MFKCPMTTRVLARRVAAELAKIPTTRIPIPGYKEYTLAVKDSLLETPGELFNLFPDNKRKQQFLWDFSWWKETEDDLEMVMACESEWIPNQVINDFQKLLVAKAPMKVLITDTQADTDNFKNKLDRQLKKYAHHIEGECYMWFDLERKPEPGKLHVHEGHVPHSWINRDAKFESLQDEPLR